MRHVSASLFRKKYLLQRGQISTATLYNEHKRALLALPVAAKVFDVLSVTYCCSESKEKAWNCKEWG